jgi:hypothetical protein
MHGRGVGIAVGGVDFHPQTLQRDGDFFAQFA